MAENSRKPGQVASWFTADEFTSLPGREPGSYILLVALGKPAMLHAGSLPERNYPIGWYAYVGSALNGLAPRLNRYLNPDRKRHWHIDYLLDMGTVRGAFVLKSTEKLECSIAAELAARLEKVSGFGCSDCRCSSHLFYDASEECVKNAITSAFSGRFTL